MARLAMLDRPTEPRSPAEDRAADVIMTAADLFYRKGFDATSMNDIAEAVNLTKAGLYYYTRGKGDLLYKIIDFAMDSVERDIIAPCQGIADPEERLREIIRHHLQTIFVSGGAITILTEEVNKLTPAERRTITARKRKYLDLVRDALRELHEAKRLRDIDITVGALNFFSTILGVARWYDPKGRLSSRQVAEETARFILAGLIQDESRSPR